MNLLTCNVNSIYFGWLNTNRLNVDFLPIFFGWLITNKLKVDLLPSWLFTNTPLKFTQFCQNILIFLHSGFEINIVSKINLLWKIKVSLMWKDMNTIFFAPKLNNIWLLLCHGFWVPLELHTYSKMAKNLDSWHLNMPKKSEHWAGLKLNTCPVSNAAPRKNSENISNSYLKWYWRFSLSKFWKKSAHESSVRWRNWNF